LIRIAGADPQVVAALARSLECDDARLRATVVYAFNDTDAARAGSFGPKISAEQAEALLPLLLSRRKEPSPYVRSELAQAMTSIVRLHPKHAKAVVSVFLAMLQDAEGSPFGGDLFALESIAEISPNQAGPIVAKLLQMLEGGSAPAAPLDAMYVLYAIGRVAACDPEVAKAAVPPLLRMLRDGDEQWAQSVGGALGAIVRNHPEQLKTVIPALLALLQDQDPALRRAAVVALTGVATAVSGQGKPR
jgi:HEAT repeat protein